MATKRFAGISEQSKAGKHRRDDAQALFEKKRWRGAMYLAGYAVECLLKAKLMRKFGCRVLDELEAELKRRHLIPGDATLYDHRIELYLRAGGGLDAMKNEAAQWSRFVIANRWCPSWRYDPDLSRPEDAEDFLAAVDAVLVWIGNNL
jgi:HEPN domain-containing protein